MLAAALVLTAGWLHFASRQLQREQQEVAAALAKLHTKPVANKPAATPKLASPLDNPPPEEASNHVVARIGALAKELGVVAGSVSVRNPENKPGNLRQIMLDARLTGQYPQLKALLAKLMEEFPTLAMDEVSMRRDQAQVEAQVRWSLYVQSVQAAPSTAAVQTNVQAMASKGSK